MTGLTKTQICNLGYEQMKLFVKPHVFLWLASEGWEKCFEVTAVPLPESQEIGLHMIGWKAGTLLPDVSLN